MEFLFAALLALSSSAEPFPESSLCFEIKSGVADVGEELAYLERLCDIEIDSHRGVVASVEGGFLPFLEEFYLKVPERNEIYLSASRSFRDRTFDQLVQWPYGSIWIFRADWVEEDRPKLALSAVDSPYLVNVAKDCNKGVELSHGIVSGDQLDFEFVVHELKIGNTVIRMSQASEAFAIVIAETFRRLNCLN